VWENVWQCQQHCCQEIFNKISSQEIFLGQVKIIVGFSIDNPEDNLSSALSMVSGFTVMFYMGR
jgi:hypothetical protein